MNALVEKGCPKVGNSLSSKQAYACLLTLQSTERKTRMTVEFLQIKIQAYERLRAEIAELKRAVEQNRLQENAHE